MFFFVFFWSYIIITRSYAALRAADLDWIVGPEYRLGTGQVHFWGFSTVEKKITLMIQSGSGGAHQVATPTWEGGRAGINKNVTDAGSQMTWEEGRAGINKNVTDAGSQLTF